MSTLNIQLWRERAERSKQRRIARENARKGGLCTLCYGKGVIWRDSKARICTACKGSGGFDGRGKR